MPGRDGTGPMGTGPVRGQGAGQGRCARHGRGGQGGGGGRRGRRNMFHATGLTGWQRAAAKVPEDVTTAASPESPPPTELQMLHAQVEAATATLDQIRQRLGELAAKETPAAVPGHEPSSTGA